MASLLPVPEKLTLNSQDRSRNWENFKQKWQNYEIASELTSKTEEVRLATLLTVIGNEALAVFNTFKWQNEQKTVSSVMKRFDMYCTPETNEIYNRYVLMSRKQKPDEKIDDYIVCLENLAVKCNYGDLADSIVRDVFVLGIESVKTRESILKESQLDLTKAVNIARIIEKSVEQSRNIAQDSEIVQEVRKSSNKSNRQIRSKKIEEIKCKYCGRNHELKRSECPAYGKKCNNCSRMNHFAQQCRASSRNTFEVEETNETDEDSDAIETQFQIQ